MYFIMQINISLKTITIILIYDGYNVGMPKQY